MQSSVRNGRPQEKALVLGEDTRAFLAIVRSLGRAGIEVHVAPADLASPALRSRYVSQMHWLPPYLGTGEEWCDQVGGLLRREQFDVVIPCDERTILPFHYHRDRFDGLTRLAIPDPSSLEILFDKAKTRELAAAHDVPVAAGRPVQPNDEAAALIGEFGLPLVLKPCRSYRLETLWSRGRATIHHDESSFSAALARIDGVPHLAEACFAGQGVGLSVLASRGSVLQAFQHRRARERNGASFYRVSAPISPDLLDAVQRMIGTLSYTGVAMFEFKVAPGSGNWILLEVNARPWGSMPLPLALGVDFPLRWYRLLAHAEQPHPGAYRIGIYCRNFVPDTRQIFAEARALQRAPVAMLGHLLTAVAQWGRLAVGREHLDVLVADDPLPGLREFRQALAGAAVRLLAHFPGMKLVQYWRDRRKLRTLLRRSQGAPVTVTVLCQGNICRSPLAAELLRRELADRAPDIRVRAAGLLSREGARSPPIAIAAARQFGVELGGHRSVFLSRPIASETTVAIVFDRHNRNSLGARYPALLECTVMLGSFLPARDEHSEIDDPDGGSLAKFQHAYKLIAAAVAALAVTIERARAP